MEPTCALIGVSGAWLPREAGGERGSGIDALTRGSGGSGYKALRVNRKGHVKPSVTDFLSRGEGAASFQPELFRIADCDPQSQTVTHQRTVKETQRGLPSSWTEAKKGTMEQRHPLEGQFCEILLKVSAKLRTCSELRCKCYVCPPASKAGKPMLGLDRLSRRGVRRNWGPSAQAPRLPIAFCPGVPRK